ncbi:tRNA pseudouridine(55) synthase [Orientia chuto str. Dubai]|uniref:tRNA pseudouridine synthase B n=1 Tax=Orientia chuto str. Dubai TaxID=1359168 RepID=A0A0F3MP11_9RICK|nr:tRNA pseudouridine(55) synthase TruB [Candidatus Orientia mediorientalis]KJV57177.1 tRNA pseudouridine(55) synthase [Orientia chuto str. Dubai]
MNGWINLYKPAGISSAQAVSKIKRLLNLSKVGHAGTLDVEAEGILPIAIGEATKLIQYLIEARKEYHFTMKFGAKTDSGDASGKVLQTTNYIPTYDECATITKKFIGKIVQVPPSYSALKINGVRAYNLARIGHMVVLSPREVKIFSLELKSYDSINSTATYLTECSKGTYIRTLSQDIALCLQSLSFVVKLVRTKVGCFSYENSLYLDALSSFNEVDGNIYLKKSIMNTEYILSNIPVLTINKAVAQQIYYGQQVQLSELFDCSLVWLQYNNQLIAIGKLEHGYFRSSRVFNLVQI